MVTLQSNSNPANSSDSGHAAWVQSVLIGDRLAQWGNKAPDWDPAQRCLRRTDDFTRRMSDKRRRLGMPIIVAMLGGTGTGKSTLVNALLGKQVVQSGNVRPTTNQPTLICRPNLRPGDWGIDTNAIQVVPCDSPALDRLVLLDCPDPDTTEREPYHGDPQKREQQYGDPQKREQRYCDPQKREQPCCDPQKEEPDLASNLAKLRHAVPYCDVLLVTATQQKYRDHHVLDELALAAPGARLIFVQTHADRDDDIRSDWAAVLENRGTGRSQAASYGSHCSLPGYETGKIYFVDSLAAFAGQERGEVPTGDFAELYSLLTAELSEETAIRIREANYVDRAEMVITQCREDLCQHWPVIEKLDGEVQSERRKLGEKLSEKMRQELRQDRRLWESQLISETSSRWWFSPFSIVLRLYLMLCDIAGFLATFRNRSVMGLAMGKAADVVLPARRVMPTSLSSPHDTPDMPDHLSASMHYGGPLAHINGLVCWDLIELQKSALSLPGFLSQANLPEELCSKETIVREANDAGRYFIAGLSGKVHEVCGKLARRSLTQWLRIVFEVILTVFLIAALYHPAKAFFSVSSGVFPYGFAYYLTAFLFGTVICLILLTVFLHLLRRGLDDQIRATVDELVREFVTESLFVDVRRQIRLLERFRDELDIIAAETQVLHETAGKLDSRLGKRIVGSSALAPRQT